MGYVIDTCIWIDVERGKISAADVALMTKDHPVYISPVTIAELKFGVEITSNLSTKQKRMAALEKLMKKPVLKIDEATGQIFGSLSSTLTKNGKNFDYRIQDLWIASQAVQHGFTLLTWNIKDFKDIPGLELASLS